MSIIERDPSEGNLSLFGRAKALILKVGCEVYLTLMGQKSSAKKSAHSLKYRQESCDLDSLPEALRGVKILFLTDPHIGGSVDMIAAEISTHIHTLLADAHPEKTLVLHGGDFVCSEPGAGMTTEANFLDISAQLFHGLSKYPQFGVIGNHDEENHSFTNIRNHLETTHEIVLLERADDVQKIEIDGAIIKIHGIHTLSTLLHDHTKGERDVLLDVYISSLNAEGTDCDIVLLHNPDGLEFLLQRLHETGKILQHPTLFLAGHTHGSMFDVPVLRDIGLMTCKTRHGRYKGWYEPRGKYADTGNWKLYVSTGMGNARGFGYRINAEPEVVMFTL